MPSSYRPSVDTIREHLLRVEQTAHLASWQRSDFSLQLVLGLRDAEVDEQLRRTASLRKAEHDTEWSVSAAQLIEAVGDPSIYRVIRLVTRATSALPLSWLTPTASEVGTLLSELGPSLRRRAGARAKAPVVFLSLCDLAARFGDPQVRSSLGRLEAASWVERAALDSACGIATPAPGWIDTAIPAWLPKVPPGVLRDPMTGLLSRAVFSDDPHRYLLPPAGSHLDRTLAPALVTLDVDRMKRILDVYGMPTGDAVLRALAEHLQSLVGDRVVRFAGDEFMILWERDGVEELATNAVASVRALRIPRVEAPDETITVTVSAGAARGSDLQSMLAAADEALGRAKNGGRDRAEFV